LNAKLLIDRVKNFTNLLVVQSGPASKNKTMLNEICDFAVNAGLSIVVYFGKFDHDWQPLWLDSAKEKWGSRFLGVYFFDEPAGSLLDNFDEMWNESLSEPPLDIPRSYDEMAEFFVHAWETMPGLATVKERTVPFVAFSLIMLFIGLIIWQVMMLSLPSLGGIIVGCRIFLWLGVLQRCRIKGGGLL